MSQSLQCCLLSDTKGDCWCKTWRVAGKQHSTVESAPVARQALLPQGQNQGSPPAQTGTPGEQDTPTTLPTEFPTEWGRQKCTAPERSTYSQRNTAPNGTTCHDRSVVQKTPRSPSPGALPSLQPHTDLKPLDWHLALTQHKEV